ncbi:histidinol dehydrogenase [Hyphobacterium sp. HN65]|uniref:Imidazoleglycerol-phosphate dehydratase n=1 Tax=Hyphobacterium lacteum TaxID=3116575 RepID=A0ABU7LSD5_9PROT|nr:histidinol dehydrogenase [Hyphobacterium sp. HN65]MEE2526821.1 histidinol dehydrogenase [Hyphobacterium sp. HN65]
MRWIEASKSAAVGAAADNLSAIEAEAAAIVGRIRQEGSSAVQDYARRFDGYEADGFAVEKSIISGAAGALEEADRQAIMAMIRSVATFHAEQGYRGYQKETWPGIMCERRADALSCAGLYVPGGSAPLISSLVMMAIPARLAGVGRAYVVTPPDENGQLNAVLAATLDLLGVHEVYLLGGAQAVGAMACGVAGLPRADKIFGPGNAWVAAAKQCVAQWPGGPAIDLPAGPSEVMVIADDTADPAFVAADLLAQAEHDPLARITLLALDGFDQTACEAELSRQLANLPRRQIAAEAMSQALGISCADRDEAIGVANRLAPEHLIIQTRLPRDIAVQVRTAGGIFIGPWTPETLGDYAAGPNHILPTGGAGRAWSGVTVESFQRTTTLIEATAPGLARSASTFMRLAEMEGLEAHAASLKIRLAALEKEGLSSTGPARRSAIVRRVTKETDITIEVDLDRSGPCAISTGVGFYDHMLEQVARHGGFALNVMCRGDLDIDPHHTIEDVALALGEALSRALGDRKGIARFGFELPMDEARAGVWIDLSGRPFAVFEGAIPGDSVGEFPVAMTEHVFRSLSEQLKAAIQVKVEGENAHHMIEACFKALGRALRQAIRIEDDSIASTKGVL